MDRRLRLRHTPLKLAGDQRVDRRSAAVRRSSADASRDLKVHHALQLAASPLWQEVPRCGTSTPELST